MNRGQSKPWKLFSGPVYLVFVCFVLFFDAGLLMILLGCWSVSMGDLPVSTYPKLARISSTCPAMGSEDGTRPSEWSGKTLLTELYLLSPSFSNGY